MQGKMENSVDINEAELEGRIRGAILAAFPFLDQSDIRHQLMFQIRMGHTPVQIDGKERYRVGGRADVLVSKAERPLVMLELKRPGIELTEDDKDQGLSYARLTTPMPPLVVVSNGNETRCYLTQTGESWDPSNKAEADLLEKIQQVGRVAAQDLDKAVAILMKSDADWAPAINEASLSVIEERSGTWGEPLFPFVRGFRIQRRATSEALQGLDQNKFVLVSGPPLAGKSNVLCQIVEVVGSRPGQAALLIESGPDGIFQALSNLLSERLGWHVTADLARDWLRDVSSRSGALLLLAVDGFQPDHARTQSDLDELASTRFGNRIGVVVSSDDIGSLPRLKATGRELTTFGRRSIAVTVGPLDDDEFKDAAKALAAHHISLTPGSRHDEGLREPWVLRALVPTNALADSSRPAGSFVRLPPVLDLASLAVAREVIANDHEGRSALDRLADALLAYYLEPRPANEVLAALGRYRVPQDYLAASIDTPALQALRMRGIIKSGLDENDKAVWWIRLPILTAALIATSLSRAHELWAEDNLPRVKALGSRLPFGPLVIAEALRLRITKGEPGSRKEIESLLADEPTAASTEDGTEFITELNGRIVRVRKISKDKMLVSVDGNPDVLIETDPDDDVQVISCSSWLALSYLAALPLALQDRESGLLVPVGSALIEKLAAFPQAIPSGAFAGSQSGLVTHDLPDGGSVVCHQEGIVEPITWSIHCFLLHYRTDAGSWIDEVATSGNLALQTRVAAALGQITSASGEIGTWAREMLEQRIVPNLKNHVIAGATEKST
ncbi:type I restriction enzyme HsdR N-terminal domain-containing protein [Stenotrophomonas sp. TWI143]|uniref:type I restriction enzyme HsdR N-terminal domain-containing protein n=1 Tax=Stenotrophomonas sp. TWI143 TaxID=3136771 RepID=UPI00320BA7D0